MHPLGYVAPCLYDKTMHRDMVSNSCPTGSQPSWETLAMLQGHKLGNVAPADGPPPVAQMAV
jgi:hypothetical protein